MKPVIICLGLSILFITLASCEKDEDNNPSRKLVGTWKLADIHAEDGSGYFSLYGNGTNFNFSMNGQDYNTTISFKENPNEFCSTGSYTTVTSYINFPAFDTTLVSNTINSVGTWSLDGDVLTRFTKDDTTTMTILELSDSKLRVRQDFKEIQSFRIGYIQKEATVYSNFVKQ